MIKQWIYFLIKLTGRWTKKITRYFYEFPVRLIMTITFIIVIPFLAHSIAKEEKTNYFYELKIGLSIVWSISPFITAAKRGKLHIWWKTL